MKIIKHGHALYKSLHGDGLACPYGCKGFAALTYGLVSHLVEKHDYSTKSAWKKATNYAMCKIKLLKNKKV